MNTELLNKANDLLEARAMVENSRSIVSEEGQDILIRLHNLFEDFGIMSADRMANICLSAIREELNAKYDEVAKEFEAL